MTNTFKMTKGNRGFQEGHAGYWTGKKRPSPSEATRKKLREARKGKTPTKGMKWVDENASKKRREKYIKEYNIKNYDRKLFLNLRRRTLKLKAAGKHDFTEWETLKAQHNWACPCCYKPEPVIKLTEDHIIPLSKGGSDNIENIQPLCKSCNSKKHTSIINYKLCQNNY